VQTSLQKCWRHYPRVIVLILNAEGFMTDYK